MKLALPAALAAMAVGCGGTAEPAKTLERPATPTSSAAVAPPGVLPAAAPGTAPLGELTDVALSVTLIPIQGADAVLAVHDSAGAVAAYVQRVDADGKLGPVLTLAGAHVAGAFALDKNGSLSIATAEGTKLCDTTFRESEIVGRGCGIYRAHALAAISGRILALSADPPQPDEDELKKAKPPPKPPPSKKGKGRNKKKKEPSPVEKLFSSGRELEVARRWILADGTSPADPEPTGLRFAEPMVGMGMIGATSRAERIDVAFYERATPRGKERRGSIGVAALDEAGTLVENSKKSFGDSKLQAGFLDDHVDPRIIGFGEGSIVLSHRGSRGKCDVTVAAPFVMPMIPESADCAVEPRRFFRLAQSKRKGTPVTLPALPEGLEVAKVRRASGQPSWEVGRVALTATRAFALYDDNIVIWTEGGAPTTVKRALVAEQLRVYGSAIANDGSAIAHTSAGLVVVDAAGKKTTIVGALPRFVAERDRSDVAKVERRLAVKVGTAWIQAEGELRRLAPDAGKPIRELYPDATAVVGGETSGMLLELVGTTLVVQSLGPGGEVTEVARIASPVRTGFDAVARRAGGAIVVGRSRGNEGLVAVAIDPQGKVAALHRVSLAAGASKRPRLSPLPGGGAILTDEDRLAVSWLDDDAAPLVAARWPTEASTTLCWDGTPARASVPGPAPDVFVPLDARAGWCMSDGAWTKDGSLRFVGSTVSSIHTRGEIGSLQPSVKARTVPPGAPAEKIALSSTSQTRCPGEMVLAGEVCVDRFESTLVDRTTGHYLSPDYPPSPNALSGAFGDWLTRRERQGDVIARALPLPAVGSWQLGAMPALVAVAREGVRPSGYVSGALARESCDSAGKRLCTLDEWRRACRGEANTLFPYGTSYKDRVCNVNLPAHPAAELHQNASIGHLDPRLNRVETADGPLLRTTGATSSCASRWGDDAIYDMVGNIDEWVDEKGGAFAGGFYSRSTTNGCESLVTAHPTAYADYSTGVRCCKDAR
ncbi:MAG: SUMF1/EgtB/PvdO family nonheme iron enzyme [Polyangiaceae bacterium]|nr:SUMF1/EgtB/PvdO family nonheme iron enzyme [Polyangiaceae bacterium]